ncbi:MAG: hypothetical protein ACRD2A_16040 [Vicinamibacterales bacterium]
MMKAHIAAQAIALSVQHSGGDVRAVPFDDNAHASSKEMDAAPPLAEAECCGLGIIKPRSTSTTAGTVRSHT